MSGPGSNDGHNGEDIRRSEYPDIPDIVIDPLLLASELNQPTPTFIPPLPPQEVTMGNPENEPQGPSASIGDQDTSTWQRVPQPTAYPQAPGAPGGILTVNNT
jgi:hypothetical protein